MAECPKCKKHLKISDWKQTCPHCGANVVLYDLQERLMKDADKAEVQNYHFQKKMDRLKGSFVGSKLAIMRIFTCFLPIGAVFLPLINAEVKAPLEPFSGGISALTLYNMMEKLNLGAFKDLLAGADTKSAALALIISVAALLLSIVFMLVHFLSLILACSPRAKIRGVIINGLMLALTLVSLLSFSLIPENSFISGSLGAGAFLFLALMILNSGVDLWLLTHPIEIRHKPCFVGGIPIEEYFKMVEDGVPAEELRAIMYQRLTEIQNKKDRELSESDNKKEEAAK